MFKQKKSKLITLFSLATLMTTSLIPIVTVPQTVYADETENTEKKEEGSLGSEGITNDVLRKKYGLRAKYAFGTQFEVTYQYLEDSFLRNNGYSSLYTGGNKGGGRSDISQYLKDKGNIGQSAELTEDEIRKAGTDLTDDEDTEKPIDTSNLAKTHKEKIAREVAKGLTSTFIDAFAVEADVKFGNTISFGGLKQYSYIKNELKKGKGNVNGSEKEIITKAVEESLYRLIFNQMGSLITGNESASEATKKFTEGLKSTLAYNSLTKNILPKGDTNIHSVKITNYLSNELSKEKTFATTYIENSKKIPSGLNLKSDSVIKANKGVFSTANKFYKIHQDDNEHFFGKETINNSEAFLKGLFSLNNIPKSKNKSGVDALSKKVKSLVEAQKSSLKKLGELNSEAGAEMTANSSLITYTPLSLYVDTTVKGFDVKAYEKLLKGKGNSLGSGDDTKTEVLDSNGKQRALQIRDMILNDASGNTDSGIMSGKSAKNRGYPVVGTTGSSPLVSERSLRQYLGIYYPSGSNRTIMTEGDFGAPLAQILPEEGSNSSNILYKAITSSLKFNKVPFGEMSSGTSIIALGLDSVGNLILTETGDILIPYWQNDLFLSNISEWKIPANTAIYENVNTINTLMALNSDRYSLDSIKKEALKKAKNSSHLTDNDAVVNKIKNFLGDSDLEGSDLTSKYYNLAKNGKITSEDNATLAMMITLATSEDVKTYNTKFMQAIDGGASFYVYPTATNFLSQSDYDDMKLSRWTASSMIQKVGMLFDYGVFEIVRLTTAQMSVSLYDSIISWAGNMFYTSNVTQTFTWGSIIYALANFAFAFMIMYLSYVAYAVFSKRVTVKEVAMKTAMMVLIIFIPYTGYNFFTNLVINEPSQLVLNDVVKQSMVVSFLEDRQSNNGLESDELRNIYEELFGTQQGDNNFTTKNYMMTFYTTTNREGQDISKLNSTSTKENGWFKSNSRNINTLTNQYNKRDLVPVQASMFDLYTWATYQVFAREGIPQHLQGVHSGKTFKNQSFFSYLKDKYATEGTYEGLEDYKEYRIDMSTLYSNEELDSGIFTDSINNSSMGKVTASELFYNLQKNSLLDFDAGRPESALNRGLSSLVSLISLFNIDYKYTAKDGYYLPDSTDLDTFIRDMSMTKYTRNNAYGNSDDLNFSDFTLSVFGKNKKYALPPEAIQTGYVPVEDYFGVYTTITNMMSKQNSQNNPRYKSAYDSTYKVVSNTLQTVASKFANMESVFNVNKNNLDTNSALQMTILMELYFNLNKELGLKNFPTTYKPESVSFDTLLKQVYIPLSKYDFQSYKVSDLVVTNLMEYLTLTENPFFIFVVFLAILGVFSMWLIYMFVFQFVMLIITLYKFVKEYLLHSNYSNKSWKGVLYIYSLMGIAKLGLAVLWWIGYTLLNSNFASYGGMTYNVAFVHSISIIIYIIFVFKKIFIPLLKNVMEDKENLGGESISRGIEKVRGDISMKGMSMKVGKSPINFAKSAGRGLRRVGGIAKGTGKLVGKVATFGGGVALTGAQTIANTRYAQSLGHTISKKSEQALRTTSPLGTVVANKIYGKEKTGLETEVDLLAENRGLTLKSTRVDYDIVKNEFKRKRLAEKMKTNVEFGEVVNLASNATKLGTTVLELNNIPQRLLASKGTDLIKYLSDTMGVSAKIATVKNDDGEIVQTLNIDTSSYDMDSQEGREMALLGLQTYALKELRDSNTIHQSGDLADDDTILRDFRKNKPMYTESYNGELLMDTTSNNGVDYITMSKVLGDRTIQAVGFEDEIDELHKYFTFEKATYTNENGGTEENLSKYRMIPKTKISNKVLEKQMENLRKIDNHTRARFNKPLSNYENHENLSYERIDFTKEEQVDVLENLVKKSHGVSLVDGNTIVYDKNNMKARETVEAYLKQYQVRKKSDFKELSALNKNISAYASNGEGYGLLNTRTLNGTEHSHEINNAFGEGYASKKSYTVALDKENDMRSSELHSSMVLASTASKLIQDKDFRLALSKKEEGRNFLRKNVRKAMTAETKNVGNALDYIKDNDSLLSSSELFKSVSEDYRNLQLQYDNKNISEEKYNSIMPFIANQATEMLENSSLLEGFTSKVDFEKLPLGVKNEEIKGQIGEIVKQKEVLKKALMLENIEDVDKYNVNENYLERAQSLFGNSGEVEVNPVNNTMIIKTDKELNISGGSIEQAVLTSNYNEMLNAEVNNDSPLIQKYVSQLPKDKKTPEDLQSIIQSNDIKEVQPKSLSEIMESGVKKPKKKKVHIAKKTPKIAEVFQEAVERTDSNMLELRDLITERYSQGKTLQATDKKAYDAIIQEITRIRMEEEMLGFMENDAKHIELHNRLEKIQKEILNFKKNISED